MPKPWIKLWIEILEDDKAGVLPDHLWRLMVECFLMAGRFDAGGRLPTLRRMAWISHKTEEQLIVELDSLKKLGITGQDNEGYYVVNFEKRQRARTGAERIADWRGRNETLPEALPEALPESYQEVKTTTTTTTSNNKGSSSSSSNDDVTNDVTKRYTNITDLLDTLGIQDLPQRKRTSAPDLVQQFTVSEILKDHDPDGAILANLQRWSAAKVAGAEIKDRPALIWCKIVEGQPPPASEQKNTWYSEEEYKELITK